MLHKISEYRTLYSITNFVRSIYLNISVVKKLEVSILHHVLFLWVVELKVFLYLFESITFSAVRFMFMRMKVCKYNL